MEGSVVEVSADALKEREEGGGGGAGVVRVGSVKWE